MDCGLRRAGLRIGRLIGRRRSGALANDFLLGRGRSRRCRVFLGYCRRIGAGRCCRGLLALPGILLGFRRRRWRRSRCLGIRIRLVLSSLVKRFRNALFKTRHAFGEYRLTIARHLLLGVDPIEPVHRIETVDAAAAARKSAGQRDEDRSGDQTLQATHGRFLVQRFTVVSFWPPAEATLAAPPPADAWPTASRRRWQSYPATVEPRWYHWRARPTGPAIRAPYDGKSHPVWPQSRVAADMLG